jgi:hypothetical protein
LSIYNFIAYQEIETRKYAPAKSWRIFKNAMNVWFLGLVEPDREKFQAIVVNEFSKEKSALRNICGRVLEDYKPIRDKEVEEKEERAEEIISLQIPRSESFYTDDYSEFKDFEITKSALVPFYLKPTYS